jgi:4-hydroxy-2-oxoglutarate aldolase
VATQPSVMPALVTPFDAEGQLDLDAHRHNLEVLIGRGVAGFLVAGSTGEGPYLEPGERGALLAAARDDHGDRLYLSCGIAAESLRQGVGQVAEAATAGADSAVVLTPTTLARGNHAAVRDYFLGMAEASPIPILLYSVPAVTGYELPIDQIVALSTHPNIIGMKDSGGRPVRIQEVHGRIEDDFVIYAGASSMLAQSMAAGGAGAITASANYAPEYVRAIVTTSQQSQAAADRLQQQLTVLVREVESHGIPGTKVAAAEAGLRPGFPRAPLRPLGGEERTRVVAALRLADLSVEEYPAV